MKVSFIIAVFLVIMCSQSAMALTKMTDEDLNVVVAQTGVHNVLSLGELTQGSVGLGEVFEALEGLAEINVNIQGLIMDIDRLEFALFKTEGLNLGHVIMEGLHLEVAQATISITPH